MSETKGEKMRGVKSSKGPKCQILEEVLGAGNVTGRRKELGTRKSTRRALLTFFSYTVAKKTEKLNTFYDLKDEWTNPPSPATAAHGRDEEPGYAKGRVRPDRPPAPSAKAGAISDVHTAWEQAHLELAPPKSSFKSSAAKPIPAA